MKFRLLLGSNLRNDCRGLFFILIEHLDLNGWVQLSKWRFLSRKGLQKAESLPDSVWVRGVEPICSIGQVSVKALAGVVLRLVGESIRGV